MPRNPGSKNKDKPADFYISKVKALGYDVTKPGKKTPQSEHTVKETFELESPLKKEAKQVKEAYRCGNPACNKVLDSAVDTCPFCGVRLTWE